MISVLACLAIAPVTLSAGISGAREPQAVATSDGKFVAVFGAGSRIYEVHEEDSAKWSVPRLVADLPGLSLGMHRGPRIAVNDSAWVITAPTLRRGVGDLMSYVSKDQGKTWKGPVRINDAPEKAPEGLQALMSWTEGRFYALWLDLRDGGMELYASLYRDGAWGKNVLVYSSPSGNVCECCHPSLSMGKGGSIQAMWRNSIDGNRDMWMARSLDGESFTEARKLGKGSWPLSACPMDGGAIGQDWAAWRRENTVYISDLAGSPELRVGEGMQPWISGNWIVWLVSKNGPLLAKSIASSADPITLASSADGPVVASAKDRHLALWASNGVVQCQFLP